MSEDNNSGTHESFFLDENGDFGIDGNDPWPSILEKLQLLREVDLKHRQIQFCIWPGTPVSEVSDFMIETIQCCSKKNYSWERLVFQDFDVHDNTHHSVLSAACRFELFKCLWLAPISNRGSAERMDRQTALVLKEAMSNPSIQEICVFMQLTPEAFEVIGSGLQNTTSLKTLSLHLGWSRQHDDRFLPPELLICGLSKNSSLETLEIDGFPEEWPENLLAALVDHPTLKTLSLKKCSWGDSSFQALASLISSLKCVLTTLDISYPDLSTGIDTDKLSTAMESNSSLQKLKLRYSGLDDVTFSKLWSSLSRWRELIEIDVTGNRISCLDLLKSDLIGLQRFDITHNPILTDELYPTSLVRFLNRHPRLICLGDYFRGSKHFSNDIQRLIDLNFSGRVLFRDRYQTHFSIWPLVLERANRVFQDSPPRQADVLYHLIQGLATNL
jgi:hypothetical protein